MAQSNFKAGDKVTLKSGGPEIIIKEIITKDSIGFGVSPELEVNKVNVTWFDGSKLMHAEFTEPQLMRIEDKEDEYFS